MIKGAQKQMIVIRTGASKYFDEAYFVLKSGIKPKREEQTDLLAEANRILKESENAKKTTKKLFRQPLVCLIAGVLLGGILASGLYILF